MKQILVKDSAIDRRGVFAASAIASGAHIIEYIGRKMTYPESLECTDKSYHYLLDMDYVIDGENDARYVNHSCDPNCYSEVVEGKVWIRAKRDICANEELTFNYGYGLEEALENKCLCGSSNCVGYIADKSVWPELRRHR